MKKLYQKEILALTSKSCQVLVDEKIKISHNNLDFKKDELIGKVIKIELTNIKPYKPFEIILENNNKKTSISFIGINKIDFIN